MLIPLLHRVLVKPTRLEEANETYKKMKALGLAIPETTDKKREERAVEVGTVIAVGDTAYRDFKADVIPKVGDTVYYAKYAGKIMVDILGTGEEFLGLNDEDVIAIISE